MKHILLLIICCLTLNFISAQQHDINELLKNAPPQVREMLKNMPPSFLNQIMKDQERKGKMTFEVIPSGSALGVKAIGAPVELPPVNEAMRGGTVMAVEVGFCGDTRVAKNMYVLSIDSGDDRNIFSTNQVDQTAKLILHGTMQRWELSCESQQFTKKGESIGGMQVDFSTSVHIRPRFFQVLAGSKDIRGKYLKEAKEAQQFMLKNAIKYYKDIGEYMKKPKISVIKIPDYGDVGGTPPAPTGMPSDAKDAVTTGSAIGTALNAVKTMAGIKSVEDVKRAVANFAIGKAEQALSKQVEELGIAEATARYNNAKELAGAIADPAGYLYDKAVQGMIQQVAAVNKQFAARDPQSANVDRAAQKEMRHKDKPYSYVDADYMLSLLNRAYDNQIKRLEAEAEMEKNLPPTSASGRIWGAGLWQELQVFAMNIGEPVAFSQAPSENRSSYDPAMLAALRKAGYPVPEVMPETKFNNGELEFDASKPFFNGRLSGTKMMQLPRGMEYPELMVMFSISSPEEPYQFEWKGNTIFDPPFINADEEDDQKKKCTYYVSTSGNNSNSGSKESPFATLQYALNKTQVCRKEKKAATIVLEDGTYRQSASVQWADLPTAPALTITSANPGGAIFTSTETSNSNWQSSAGGWQTSMPLHPQQPAWTATGNIATNPPPQVMVNDQKLVYIPIAKNLPVPGSYNIAGGKITVRPPDNVANINNAEVQVSIRPFAIKMTGAKNVTISDIAFKFYPRNSGNQHPGITKQGGSQINIKACIFE